MTILEKVTFISIIAASWYGIINGELNEDKKTEQKVEIKQQVDKPTKWDKPNKKQSRSIK